MRRRRSEKTGKIPLCVSRKLSGDTGGGFCKLRDTKGRIVSGIRLFSDRPADYFLMTISRPCFLQLRNSAEAVKSASVEELSAVSTES